MLHLFPPSLRPFSRSFSRLGRKRAKLEPLPSASSASIDEYMSSKQPQPLGGWSSKWAPGDPGFEVPYKFRIDTSMEKEARGEQPVRDLTYTHFVGNRFPVVESAENFRYWKSRGFDRLMPKLFPIKLMAWRRVHPHLREYIFFLHSLDPARFTHRRIAERYGLKEKTVEKLIKHFSAKFWIQEVGLSSDKRRQHTRETRVWNTKEKEFAKAVGYQTIGDEDIDSESDHEFDGWRSTHDWVRKQEVEVEMMSAFPMPAMREPVPRRLDVDLVVENTGHAKVVNWIDPNDKVPF